MATRGKASAAALETQAVPAGRRPAPPDGLTAEQRAEWKGVVDRMPADWFTREVQPLLVLYVQHIATGRKLGSAIDAYDAGRIVADIEGFEKLTKMREREGRAASSLATRMRLTPQSRYNPAAAHTATKTGGKTAKKPWED